jgi:hypothetical protein
MKTLTIDAVDRTSLVQMGSVKKKDTINQQVDTLDFSIIYHAGQTFRPAKGSVVVLQDGVTTIFSGKIYKVTKKKEGIGTVKYSVKCKDHTIDLNRYLVVEEYNNQTVNQIVSDILTNFSDGTFTMANVDCAINIVKVIFNRTTVTETLQRLSDYTGYSWYVDYDKDIHFFETNSEPAPFSITDDNGMCILDTLEIDDDLSQIRNRVFIQGGEVEGDARTEPINGDGVKKQFKLSNKFSSLPTVTVGAVSQTVGVDFLDNEDDFDCFWDFNNTYVRFKDTTIPASGTNNIEVTGTPLYNLVVQVSDPASITQYGIYEYKKIDKTLKSREEAVAMAQTELTGYKDGLVEGSFDTYEDGLRSGQVITIQSTLLDITETFLIQSVSMTMIGTEQSYYHVELATLRTINMIQLLINMLKSGDRIIEDKGETVLEKTEFPFEYIEVSDTASVNTNDLPQTEAIEIDETVTVQALDYPVEFVLGPVTPTGYKRQFILNGSPLA